MSKQAAHSDAPAEGQAYTSFKYGMPIYGLGWPEGNFFFICGGGGSVSSGIKNKVVCAQRIQGMLTDPAADHDFDKNCPLRLTISPNGKSIVLAMAQGGVRRVDIESQPKGVKLVEVKGEVASKMTADKTEYKALAFCPRGDTLLLGGVDGSIKVAKWPAMEEKFALRGEARLADGVRDISAAPGARSARFAVVLENGTAEVWDWEQQHLVCAAGLAKGDLRSTAIINMTGPSANAVQPLPKDMHGARFACLRYAPASTVTTPTPISSAADPLGPPADPPLALYALMNNRQGCWVVLWHQDAKTGMLHMVQYQHVAKDPASCLDVSRCGRYLAVGTSQATIVVVDVSHGKMKVIVSRLKTHTVFCTGVVFSADSKHVLSVSGDASATLTSTAAARSTVMTRTQIIKLLIIITAFCMLMLLQTIRVLKSYGRHDLVLRIRNALGLSVFYDTTDPLKPGFPRI